MHPGAGDEFGVGHGRDLAEIPASRKAAAFGIAQEAYRHGGEYVLRHIDQEQRDEDFIRVEPRLQDGRDHRPEPAAEDTRHDHHGKDQPRFHGIECKAHTGAEDGTHDVLPLGPDVPDARLEPKRQADRDQDQRPGLHQKLRTGIGGELFVEERVPEDGSYRLYRVLPQKDEHDASGDHRQDHGEYGGCPLPEGAWRGTFFQPDHARHSMAGAG